MARFVVKLGNASFNHVLMDKGWIKIWSYTFENNSQEVIVSLENAFLHGESLYMLDAWYLLQDVYHRVVHHHRVLVLLLQGQEVGYLYMASESYHLVADGMFEAQHHAYWHDHDGETDGNTRSGYMNSRARNFTFVALIAI